MAKLSQLIIPIEFFYSNFSNKIRRKYGGTSIGALCLLAAEQTNAMAPVKIQDAIEILQEAGASSASGLIEFLVEEGMASTDGETVSIHFCEANIGRYKQKCEKNLANANARLRATGLPVGSQWEATQSKSNFTSESKSNFESNSESNSNPSNHQESTTTGAREDTPETSSSKLPTDEDFLGWDDPPQPVSETPPPEPPKPTKTPKLGSAKPSGASRIERKVAAIERLIQETSKPLWFTGSEPINELRRFLEICQAKKKIPKFASTVSGWLAQYESLDHFLLAVQLSIKNEWCTLLRYSDVVRYSGGDKKINKSEEIKKSFWNLREQLSGDQVYEKN